MLPVLHCHEEEPSEGGVCKCQRGHPDDTGYQPQGFSADGLALVGSARRRGSLGQPRPTGLLSRSRTVGRAVQTVHGLRRVQGSEVDSSGIGGHFHPKVATARLFAAGLFPVFKMTSNY